MSPAPCAWGGDESTEEINEFWSRLPVEPPAFYER